ncbi:hypothetical protein FACS189483_11100 [Spirochaetia bacterium]|nr:hypothetical protein FACS189483_11100 [Spirochaetia bacterium]
MFKQKLREIFCYERLAALDVANRNSHNIRYSAEIFRLNLSLRMPLIAANLHTVGTFFAV